MELKTRITQNIDGYDIIIGIGEAQIDPVQTNPVMIQNLILTDEYKAVESKKKEMTPICAQILQLKKDHKSATNISDKNKISYEYQKKNEELAVLELQLRDLSVPLLEKQKELIVKHAVYFQPKEGEEIISLEDAEIINTKMSEVADKGMWLDVNLKEICDYRAQTAWIKTDKWLSREIVKLGDDLKSGEILQNKLSESQLDEISEQLDLEAISKMSTVEKSVEKALIISNLARQASEMRSTLEIQGDSKALLKSQEWYKSEVEKVNSRYS